MSLITINKTECVGTSLTSINANFDDLDTRIAELTSTYLVQSNNLSDIDNASTARNNLGLGTAATKSSDGMATSWVRFNGLNSATTVKSGSLTRSSSTITVNAANNFVAGDIVWLSGTGWTSKTVEIATASPTVFTATDVDVFTGTTGTGTILSATASWYEHPIVGQYNVKNVVRVKSHGDSDYAVAVLFTSIPANANYAAIVTGAIGGSAANNDDQTAGVPHIYRNGYVIGVISGSSNEQSTIISGVTFGP